MSKAEETKREPTAGELIRKMKMVGEGCMKMGDDGVMRSFGGPPERVVFDAVGFSPAQIKAMLDLQPWSQEIEDLYRGVDGRKVVDHEALYNPPDSYRPPKWTAEEFAEKKKETAKRNKELMERIEKEREEGVDVDAKYACSREQADYDLSPKGDK
ncbi:uncharacterized protein K444DRAFT_631612 [Hyaloscypha bicolor E]|uniref:Uncharacterized protein n=1 Tax=Hyaloscypha bicolor E TaxID=1095630 RepID=A0A2J6T4M5_9HELO|nr:uncharacterized protein K444DRAFT_631612 [Hyaloscypha bicolor E]PMD57883.1 hypothetical protein K444DRAFT_631612 [Hyaloscypha bicolor E]